MTAATSGTGTMSTETAPIASAGSGKTAAGPARRRRGWLTAVLALLLVGALVTIGLLLGQIRHDRAEHRAGAEAQRAARAAVVAMTTYDHSTVEKDFSWVEDAGTPKFRQYFTEASVPTRKAIEEIKAHAEGTVVASAVTVRDDRHVTVLMFVDQQISNAAKQGAALTQPRVLMKMVREGDTWLVDSVQLKNRPTG